MKYRNSYTLDRLIYLYKVGVQLHTLISVLQCGGVVVAHHVGSCAVAVVLRLVRRQVDGVAVERDCFVVVLVLVGHVTRVLLLLSLCLAERGGSRLVSQLVS